MQKQKQASSTSATRSSSHRGWGQTRSGSRRGAKGWHPAPGAAWSWLGGLRPRWSCSRQCWSAASSSKRSRRTTARSAANLAALRSHRRFGETLAGIRAARRAWERSSSMERSLFCAKQTPATSWTSTAAACMRPPRSTRVVIPRSRHESVSSDRARGESRLSTHSSRQNANRRARQLGPVIWALRGQCLEFASGPCLLRMLPADVVVGGRPLRLWLATANAQTHIPPEAVSPPSIRPNLGCGASVTSSSPKSRSSISDSGRCLHPDAPPVQGYVSMAARYGQTGYFFRI